MLGGTDISSITFSGRKVSTFPAAAAAYVTPDRVNAFVAELQARVGSVTVHGSIYKLRRMAQVLDPDRDFSWLAEIENDLAAAMRPQPKFGRVVYSHVLIKAGQIS